MSKIKDFHDNLSPVGSSMEIEINKDLYFEINEKGNIEVMQVQSGNCWYIYFDTPGHLLNLVFGRMDGGLYICYKLDSQIDVDDRTEGEFEISSFVGNQHVEITLTAAQMSQLRKLAHEVLWVFFKINVPDSLAAIEQ